MEGQFERFSEDAKQSLIYAQEIAAKHNVNVVDTSFMLLGFLKTTNSIANEVLVNFGLTAQRLESFIVPGQRVLTPTETKVGLSFSAQRALEKALMIARKVGDNFVGTEHILLAIMNLERSEGALLVKQLGISPEVLGAKVEEYFEVNNTYNDDIPDMSGFGMYRPTGTATKQNPKLATIEKYGLDLTDAAKHEKLDPVIGREKEISRLVSILNRRTKNNPVLIGEPGVGKTAIVEGLAQRISHDNVPDLLMNKRVLVLDLPGVVAGTKYRGEFEERLMKIVEEAKSSKDIILFIDEIHNLVGAGAAEGAIDAANILKPALSRGEIQVIGATTLDEYRKYIEKDAALERRFQPIIVPETTPEETKKILEGIRPKFEDYHRVKISDSALEAAIKMASRYISDRFMPDKAIDLIDEAASLQKIKKGGVSKSILRITREIKDIVSRKEDAVLAEDFAYAAKLKQEEDALAAKLKSLRKREGLSEDSYPVINEENIAEVISISTGIPVTRLVKKESESLLNLDQIIKGKVIGQQDAVKTIASAIRRSRTGVSDTNRPIGSFMFMGPTGVGKTELARVLASEMFGSVDALVKFDMSEFMEKHNVSRLVGAPAGYVGYEDSGQLTETIRRRPYSVVLLDEIEKAHPDVFNILLQILEDGYLTDAKGTKVDFRNTIIIMTSNIGANRLNKEVKLGFSVATRDEKKLMDSEHEKQSEMVMEDLKKRFKPEFLNRLDKVIVFRALDKTSIEKIVDLQISELAKRLIEQKISIKVTKGAKQILVEKGYDPENGARPLKRTIQNLIEDPLANGILSREFKEGDTISVLKEKNTLKLYVLEAAK